MSQKSKGNSVASDEAEDGDSSDQEMLDLVDQPSFLQDQADANMVSQSSSRRGRKKIPIKWTRFIECATSTEPEVQLYPIEDDIDDEYELP